METSISAEPSAVRRAALERSDAPLGILATDRVFAGTAVLQLVISWVLCTLANRPLFVGLDAAYDAFISAIPVYGAGVLAFALVRERMRLAPDAPFGFGYRVAWRGVLSRVRRTDYVIGVALAFAILPASMAIFSAAKRTIPILHPFAWDTRLERIGRAIHGGRHAWQWLQPLVNDPPAMRAAATFYHGWWPIAIFGAAVIAALCPPSRLRTRYLVACVLTWCVIGTVFALLLSSAGPPYYAALTGDSGPYGALFLALRHEHVPSLVYQSALWHAYRVGVDGFGLGISAMPSVHVATATLLACAGFALRRWLGFVLSIGAVLTFLASIALGWHYALDGYVGAALAVAIWWVSGRLSGVRRPA